VNPVNRNEESVIMRLPIWIVLAVVGSVPAVENGRQNLETSAIALKVPLENLN
jgi:hypothetical protein